jgi:unsaturated pyranuronate lyase
MTMDYYAWVDGQRGTAPPVTEWDKLPPERVSDPNVSSHTGSVRRSFVGNNVVLARIVLRAGSAGQPHRHASEQVALVLRGGVRLTIDGEVHVARAGSVFYIPPGKLHLIEVLDEETEVLDIYSFRDSAEELRKSY